MYSVIAVANGLAIMSRKMKAESTKASCWKFPVPCGSLVRRDERLRLRY